MGKLPKKELNELLSCIKKDSRVIIPPAVGYDSGVHLFDGKYMVVSTDPCTGVPEEWFGWFLIHYAASDVAVFGARPKYVAINLLGPSRTDADVFKRIMQQACQAADKLKISIITGHTGTYDDLSTIVGTCTAYGFVKKSRLITPGGARPNDRILCIKPVGQETLINFALTHRRLANKLFGSEATKLLAEKIEMQTCVNEALTLASMGGVTAMHDAAEGGLVLALNEMADASKIGFNVDYSKLLIGREMRILAGHFELSRRQALSTSSTGTLIAAVAPKAESRIIEALAKKGTLAASIGIFKESGSRTLKCKGKTLRFPAQAVDPYSKIMGA